MEGGKIANIKVTQPRKAGLIPPEESLHIVQPVLLHVAPHHDGVPVEGVYGVDRVGDGVVELAHVLRTADLLRLLITDVPTDKAGRKMIEAVKIRDEWFLSGTTVILRIETDHKFGPITHKQN